VAEAGRGALLAVKKGGAALFSCGALRPSGAFVGLRSAKPVALLERRRVLRASGLIAPSSRKQAVVRPSEAELRAAPWCGL